MPWFNFDSGHFERHESNRSENNTPWCNYLSPHHEVKQKVLALGYWYCMYFKYTLWTVCVFILDNKVQKQCGIYSMKGSFTKQINTILWKSELTAVYKSSYVPHSQTYCISGKLFLLNQNNPTTLWLIFPGVHNKKYDLWQLIKTMISVFANSFLPIAH